MLERLILQIETTNLLETELYEVKDQVVGDVFFLLND
jgi:hypothetical protein